jgi:hypothetical protein
MSKLHALLAVTGAIDDIVSKSQDPEILKIANESLPGTGVAQRGWYAEIQSMAGVLAPADDESATGFPSLNAAIDDLLGSKAGIPANNDVLSRHDLARASFVGSVLVKLKAAGAHVPVDDKKLEELCALSDTPRVPCTGSLRKVNGEFVTVITTEYKDMPVTVDQMKKVIDPQNWPSYCSFFQDMKFLGFDENKWTRILEIVGTDFRLQTMLKFWKGELSDGGIFVNYDLDDHRSTADGDDGLVVVDNGFIQISPAAKPDHVDIFTSKELLIPGLSPTATAILACQLGWAEVGEQMFDAASKLAESKPKVKIKINEGWAPSDGDVPGKPEPKESGIEQRMPKGLRGEMIKAATQQVDAFADRMTVVAEDFARAWEDGLDREEVKRIAATFGQQMADYSLQLFDAPKRMFITSRRKVDAGEGDLK